MFGQDVKWVEFTPEEFVDYLLRLKLVDTEEEASKELAFVMRNKGRYTRMTRRLKTEISIIPNKLTAEKGTGNVNHIESVR